MLQAATHVVNLSPGGFNVLVYGIKRANQIFHAEHIADLPPVAINNHGLALQRGINKVRYPSLVFRAKLPRAGNTGHTKDNRRQTINATEVADILIRCALGTSIRRVEIERLRFRCTFVSWYCIAFAADDRKPKTQITIYLVG